MLKISLCCVNVMLIVSKHMCLEIKTWCDFIHVLLGIKVYAWDPNEVTQLAVHLMNYLMSLMIMHASLLFYSSPGVNGSSIQSREELKPWSKPFKTCRITYKKKTQITTKTKKHTHAHNNSNKNKNKKSAETQRQMTTITRGERQKY